MRRSAKQDFKCQSSCPSDRGGIRNAPAAAPAYREPETGSNRMADFKQLLKESKPGSGLKEG